MMSTANKRMEKLLILFFCSIIISYISNGIILLSFITLLYKKFPFLKMMKVKMRYLYHIAFSWVKIDCINIKEICKKIFVLLTN